MTAGGEVGPKLSINCWLGGTCQLRIFAQTGKPTVRKADGNAEKGLRKKRMPTL
ncbi:hypothetical protein [Enterococcus gallinarum]|uniref:hypothetical protein n=1 Tax=Enterococcus gallinarum TaxID=1353 RepID=UPI001C3C6D72|nr:hypothetical protein [Enterococcus gallinarum]